MLKKLRSVFRSPASRLALKCLVLTGLLIWQLSVKPAGFLPTLLFLSASFYFYWKPILRGRQFFSSFLILLIVSILGLRFLNFTILGIISALGIGLLFYWLLGVKNLIFSRRSAVYYLLSSFLFFSIFFFFFLADKSQFFWFKYLAVGIGVFFLSGELLSFFVPDLPKKRKILASAGFTFLVLEILWTISLLPIGFLNSAALTLFALLIAMDLTIHHFNGALTRKIVLRNATSWIVLSLIIFAASRWSL